jgi:signal transduction histidine kinase
MLQPFELRPLVATLAKGLSVVASGKAIDLATDIGADVPHEIVGDALRLRQILANLLGNAIKFTEQGSIRVSVQTQTRTIQRSCYASALPIQALVWPQRNFLRSSTRSYRRIHRPRGVLAAQGLGLTISARLVEMMGGQNLGGKRYRSG